MGRIDEIFKKWRVLATKDLDLIKELNEIENDNLQIFDRFYKNLDFGTAGIRGVIGAGTNRMNVYVVGRITQAFCTYLKSIRSENLVVIGFDNRIKSEFFAKAVATVFIANGIRVKIFKELKPVPILSYAIRYFKCAGGVMITASHNPADYNGYKIYGSEGYQIIDDVAEKISKHINEIDVFTVKFGNFCEGIRNGLISFCGDDVEQNFLKSVEQNLIQPEILNGSGLKLVYTPLNGTGMEPVQRILKNLKIGSFYVVEQQKNPDGKFPTCKHPNPEQLEAFDLALKECAIKKPDVAIANDPDCDRVGVVVLNSKKGCYEILNGNQIGVLMLDYICQQRLKASNMPKNAVAIKTIVSTPMVDKVAMYYGISLVNVLTGFRYIGEKVTELERYGGQSRFIFGFEESQGYLAGSYVRDKDGVYAAMLICEMVVFYKKHAKTLLDALEDLYKKFGYYKSYIQSYVLKGKNGTEKMLCVMNYFRTCDIKRIGEMKVLIKSDYLFSKSYDLVSGSVNLINLPKSNVLEFELENDLRIIVRPSGTEPKLKIYYHAVSNSKIFAEKLLNDMQKDFIKLLRSFTEI